MPVENDNQSVASVTYVNIAGYRFVDLENLEELRLELRDYCRSAGLKGTILLSQEGINLFMAGERDAIDDFVELLTAKAPFAGMEFKESPSDHQPFSRMLVRIKNEIIAFGQESVVPSDYTSKKISASELKQWLDENRDVILLDVRNDYEVEVGTFENALPAGIDNFREFPRAVEQLSDELKQKPLVMFCTGGIRCEKAGPFMEQAGFENVFQLDGGILKYFEDIGGRHYEGDCFVFDKRVAVDSDLAETDATLCYACQAVLDSEQVQSPRYNPPLSCPMCYVEPDEQMVQSIAARHQALKKVTSVLPGSIPYENIRPLRVGQRHDGMTLLQFLADIFPHLEEGYWSDSIDGQRIKFNDEPLSADSLLQTGQKLTHHFPRLVEPDVDPNLTIVFEDEHLVVVNKSAPLPVHPSGRFNKNTLKYFLDQVYAPQLLRPAHRLDAYTTGLIALTRTRPAARDLQTQFATREVKKTYLAKVHGQIVERQFKIEQKLSDEKHYAGSRAPDDNGKVAITDCRVVSGTDDKNTTLEIDLQTGRTHQIRIHLASQGNPIVGDMIYGAHSDNELMNLHSWRLAFKHPISQEPIEFEAPLPDWMSE